MQEQNTTDQKTQQTTTPKEKFCYPLKIFMSTEIQNELKCAINNEILHEPVIDGCGHRFCKKCITHYIDVEKQNVCPISKKKITLKSLKIPEKSLIDQINNLQVKCMFFKSGCQFTGILSDIDHHLQKVCPIQLSRNLFSQAKEHVENRQLDKVIDLLNEAIKLREISNTDLDISAASFYIRKALTQAELNEFTQAETTLLKGVQTLDLPDESETEQEKKEKAILKIQTFKNFAIILEAKNQSNVNIYYEKALREAETLNDYVEQYKIKILQAEFFKQQQQKQQQEKKSQQEQEEDMQLIQQFMFQQMMNMQQNPNFMENPEMDDFLMKLNKPQENKAVIQLERVIDQIDDILQVKQTIKTELTSELKEQLLGQKITAIQSLGNIYMEMMTFDKAKLYYEKSLSIVETEQVSQKLKANVLYDLGVHYREVAMQKQNKEMLIMSQKKLQEALVLLEKEPEQSQQQILRIKMEIAQTHDMLQNPQEAMKLHEEVLKIQEKLRGQNSEEVAHCYTLIAATHATQNNWQVALQYETKAYEICKEQLKKFEKVPDRAIMLKKKMLKMCNNIYTTNRDHEKMWEAIKFLGQQYQLTKEVFTEVSEEMVEVMDQVAKMMSVMRRWKKAFKYHKKIIDVKIQLKGENSFEVSEAYVNFAEVYQMKKDNKSAIDLIKKAVDILEKLLKLKGTEQFNPELFNKGYFLIHWLQRLADIYEEEQDLKLMVKYLSKVVQLKNEVDNPFADLVKASFMLATYYFKERHYMRALDYLQQTLDFIKQLESENPMDQMRRMMQDQKTSQLLMNSPKPSFKVDINLMYAGIYEQMKQYSKMLNHSKSALELSIKVNGEFHKDTLDSYLSVGKAYRHLKQFPESMQILQNPLPHIIAQYGLYSTQYSEQIYQIANTYFWLGNDEDDLDYALENFQESNYIRKNKGAIDRGVNFVSLGFYYYKRHQYEQQDIFMRNALEQFENGYKMNRLGVCKSLDLIGKLFEKLEDDYQALLMYKKSFLIKKELAKGVLKQPKHLKHKLPKKYKKAKNAVQKKFMKQQKQKMMQRGEIMEIIRELSDISIDENREEDFLDPVEMSKLREEKQVKKLYPNETPLGKYVRETKNQIQKYWEYTKVFIFGQDLNDLYQGLDLERKQIKMIEKKKEYYKTQQNEKIERLKQKVVEDSKKSLADTYFYIGLIYEKQDILLGYQFVNKGFEIKQKYFDHDHYELIEMQKKKEELVQRLKKADIFQNIQNDFNCDLYISENIIEKSLSSQLTQYEIQEQKKKQNEYHVKCMQRREAEKIKLMKEVEKIKKEEREKKKQEIKEAKEKQKMMQKLKNGQVPQQAEQQDAQEIEQTKQPETMEGQEGEHLDALFKKGFLQSQEQQTQQGPAQIMGEQVQYQPANMLMGPQMLNQQQHMQPHHMDHMDPLQFMQQTALAQNNQSQPDQNAMQQDMFNFLNQFQMEQQNMIQEQQQEGHHQQQQEFNPFMNMNPQQFGEFNQFMQMAAMAQGAGAEPGEGFNPFAMFQNMQQNHENDNDEQDNMMPMNNEQIQQRQYMEEFQKNLLDPEFHQFAQNFAEQFQDEMQENINFQPGINQQNTQEQLQQMAINYQMGLQQQQDENNVEGVFIQQEQEDNNNDEVNEYHDDDADGDDGDEQEQLHQDDENLEDQEQQEQQFKKKQKQQEQQLSDLQQNQDQEQDQNQD